MTTFILSLILLCAATPYILYGQQYTPQDSVSTHHLETVVVRAPREPDYKRGVIPAQQLSGQELKALSAFSIADALRSFSGVQVKDFGGVGDEVVVSVYLEVQGVEPRLLRCELVLQPQVVLGRVLRVELDVAYLGVV